MRFGAHTLGEIRLGSGQKGGGPKGWEGRRGEGVEGWGPKPRKRGGWAKDGEQKGGGRRVGAKISRFFFPLPTLFLFFFFQFLRSFMELRWFLRVFIIENVVPTHIWSSLDIL